MSDLDHISRTELPWRTGVPRTECGLPDTPALTTDEFVAKARREGQKRLAMTTCMTCHDKRVMYGRVIGRDSIVEVLSREVQRVIRSRKGEERDDLEREMTAIAALIEEHRSEFDGLVDGLRQTTSLDERRKRRGA